MSNPNNHLHYLTDLSGYKVKDEDPDVRDWKVLDKTGRTIGSVDSFLVSKEAKKVRYLNVKVDESIIEEGHEPLSNDVKGPHEFINSDGENRLIIPVGMVRVDEKEKSVTAPDITRDTFARTKRLAANAPVSAEYEIYVLRTYRGDKPEGEKTPSDKNYYDQKEFGAHQNS